MTAAKEAAPRLPDWTKLSADLAAALRRAQDVEAEDGDEPLASVVEELIGRLNRAKTDLAVGMAQQANKPDFPDWCEAYHRCRRLEDLFEGVKSVLESALDLAQLGLDMMLRKPNGSFEADPPPNGGKR